MYCAYQVEREKATLTLIQSQLEAVEMKTSKDHNIKQSSAHAVTGSVHTSHHLSKLVLFEFVVDAPASDRSMTNMHTVLNWMLKRLENQIDSTEKVCCLFGV